MTNILSGLIAAVLSLLINKLLLANLGRRGVIYLVPLTEELLKTGLAYYLANELIITHFVFGLFEASLDFFNNNLAASLALLTHLLFGFFTYWFWRWTNRLVLSIILVTLVHIVWNYLINDYQKIYKRG